MGSAASAVAKEELAKPLDGSDITELEAGKAEVARLRKLLAVNAGLGGACVIVCTDGSKSAELAFDIAMTLRPEEAKVEILNILLPGEEDELFSKESIDSNYSAKMVARGVQEGFGRVVFEEKKEEEPTKQAIVRYVNEKGYGKVLLTAMGFRGRDRPMGDVTVMGSSTDLATRDADCAALIVKAGYSKVPEADKPKVFCLAVDGSAEADEAVKLLKRLAKPEDKIYAMMIDAGQFEAEPRSKERKEQYEKDDALIFELKMKGADSISETIMNYADEKEAHFLCCGADGIGGYKKSSLGSVSEYLVQKWKGSIIVARLPTAMRTKSSTAAAAAAAASS